MSNDSVKAGGFFRRIFLLYAAILVLAVLAIELSITSVVRKNYIDTLQGHLAVQAGLAASGLSFTAEAPQDALCRHMKEKTGSRTTLIALNGRVLGDSDAASAGMDNHAERQELQQAALGGVGTAIRASDTLKTDFLYVAVRVMDGPRPKGYVRLAMPLTAIDRSVNLLRSRIIVVVTFILLAAGAFSLWQLDRIRRLTGRIRDFSRSVARGELGKSLFLDQAGEFDEIARSLNTMSAELRKSLAASDEEKHRLQEILRSIPDALFIIDARGVILLASSAASSLFGDVLFSGKRFIEVVRNNEFLSLVEEVRQQGQAGTAELRIDHPGKRYLVVRVSPLRYRREDALSGFVAIFHDITQLRKLEQTRKNFVANLSHELKTPIAAITGFAETLLEGALDDRQHAIRFLQTIKTNSERINRLVDDLMTISKIELGVIRIEKAPVDIVHLAEQVIATLADKASGKGLALAMAISPEVKELWADRDRLLQVLTNLADNAIKFTDKGGVTLGAGVEEGRTCLFVEDTGIGIPQRHLPRIGERFYRVDPGRSRSMGGTGLGLAIVKHLVKAHGWDLRIESAPGKGTKVRIYTEEATPLPR